MKLILKSKNGTHFATAEYDNNTVLLLSGSKINLALSYDKMPLGISEKRNDRNLVDKNGIVLRDIEFDSPTSAAKFVTGRSCNGYIAWRPDDKMSLKSYLEDKLE